MTAWTTVPGFSGRTFKLIIDAAAGAEYSEMAAGTYDRDVLHILARGCRDAVAWDVGAHIGYSSLMLLSDWGVAAVHAFEPHPGNVMRLRNNVGINSAAITAHELALSDTTGGAVLNHFSGVDALQSTGAYLQGETPPLEAGCYAGFEPIAVRCVRGDDVVADCTAPVPDLVKIDVEGAELKVLTGLTKTLRQRLPTILLEAHSPALQTACTGRLMQWGYRVQTIRILGGGRAHLLATA